MKTLWSLTRTQYHAEKKKEKNDFKYQNSKRTNSPSSELAFKDNMEAKSCENLTTIFNSSNASNNSCVT